MTKIEKLGSKGDCSIQALKQKILTRDFVCHNTHVFPLKTMLIKKESIILVQFHNV